MGYGPAVLIIAGFFAMALFIPSIAPEQNVSVGVSSTNTGAGIEFDRHHPAGHHRHNVARDHWDNGAGHTHIERHHRHRGGRQRPSRRPPESAPVAVRRSPGDPYSPPCMTFSGSNGGATSRGVTANTITVTYMNPTDGSQSVDQAIQAYTGSYNSVIFPETYAQKINTLQELVTYFNEHFQFYGRKIVLQVFNGQQDSAGDNQRNVKADALNVADTIKAFAELNGTSQAYVEALTAQKVSSFRRRLLLTAIYQQQSPYSWSFTPDCTELGQEVGAVAAKDMVGHTTQWAGTGVGDGKPRVFAVVVPDEQIYRQCAAQHDRRP